MGDRYFNHVVGCLESSIESAEDGVTCHISAVTVQGAVDLLKEKEAVEPIPFHRSDGTIFRYECRKCRTKIFKMDLFCRHCGRPVKWDG